MQVINQVLEVSVNQLEIHHHNLVVKDYQIIQSVFPLLVVLCHKIEVSIYNKMKVKAIKVTKVIMKIGSDILFI